MVKTFVSGLAVAIVLAATPASATVVNFNSLASATTETPADVDSNGFTFAADPTGTLLVWGADLAQFNADSTGATLSTQTGNQSVIVTKDGGGSFTLNSLDLTDVYNSQFGYGGDVKLTFNYSAGGSSSQTVSLDTLAGLQTFTFDQAGLSSFSISGITTANNLFQLDNVVFDRADVASPAPELATWAMMLAGFGAMGAAMRRRRMVSFA